MHAMLYSSTLHFFLGGSKGFFNLVIKMAVKVNQINLNRLREARGSVPNNGPV